MLIILAAALLLILVLIYPRQKGDKSPPLVNASSIPIIGPIIAPLIEFGASPMKMVQRCTDEFGPIFTVQFITERLTFLVGTFVSILLSKNDQFILHDVGILISFIFIL